MNSINKTQKKIYEFLLERSQSGIPPSVREIGAAVGLKSTSSVQANLDALEEAGFIERDPMLKRSIRVLGESDSVTSVPLLGTVTAGVPILIPLVTKGLCGSFGTVFLFAVIPTLSSTFAISLPVLPVFLKSSVIK